MSRATELAEIDAAITEADLSDDEAKVAREGIEMGVPVQEAIRLVIEARTEEVAELAANAGVVGELTPDQLEALDRQLEIHTRKVKGILGGAAEALEACPECGGMGLHEPGPEPPMPKPHEFFKACETCNALGQVLTGSLVAGNVSRPCPDCGGRGYLEQLDGAGNALAGGNGTAPVPAVVMPPPPGGDQAVVEVASDATPRFGRPAWMGDPNLGN